MAMAYDGPDASPPSRKRHLRQTDPKSDCSITPESAKRRKLSHAVPEPESPSPQMPMASTATAASIDSAAPQPGPRLQQTSVVTGSGASQPLQSSSLPLEAPSQVQPSPLSHIFKARPAIKLAALRGTVWDTGQISRASLPRKPATTCHRLPASQQSPTANKAGGRRPGRPPRATLPRSLPLNKSGSQSSGFTKNGTADGYSTDELGADMPSSTTPTGHGRLTGKASVASDSRIPPPKGILTPSKKRGSLAPKSVTFNDRLDGGLRREDSDPLSARSPTGPDLRSDRILVEEEADELDSARCAICKEGDSQSSNRMVFCQNCNFTAHQKCYQLLEVPIGDWLCRSCTQEDVLATADSPNHDAGSETVVAPAVEVPDIVNLDRHVRTLQRVLLDRCCGRRPMRLIGLDDLYGKVRQVVEQTVVAGEGNSMLLIGPRGCGKTTMIESILLALSREHDRDFHVVRLNGFIHTDDKAALKEIWRQLGEAMRVEDELLNRASYADTMASLLALLSHPSEIMGTGEGVTSQSVVFVIDEFDMFAAHARQMLLYILLDIAQSRKAPIAVLGCTTRLDVVETLEKRVKSRFSHRYAYLPLPKSLPAYWQICRQGLVVDRADVEKEGIDELVDGFDDFHDYWMRKIEELYKQPCFQELLQYHYYATKSVSAFLSEWVLPLSALSAQDMRLACPQVDSAAGWSSSLGAPDSRLQLLSALSELDLSMLLAAARLEVTTQTDTVNFAMAYDEYCSLVGRDRTQSATWGLTAVGGHRRMWSRSVAGVAWERLISLGLLAPAGTGGSGRTIGGDGGVVGKPWRVEVALEEIAASAELNTEQARWCRQL